MLAWKVRETKVCLEQPAVKCGPRRKAPAKGARVAHEGTALGQFAQVAKVANVGDNAIGKVNAIEAKQNRSRRLGRRPIANLKQSNSTPVAPVGVMEIKVILRVMSTVSLW